MYRTLNGPSALVRGDVQPRVLDVPYASEGFERLTRPELQSAHRASTERMIDQRSGPHALVVHGRSFDRCHQGKPRAILPFGTFIKIR